LDRLYFYGVLYGIGVCGFVSSIILGFIYERNSDIIGCVMALILSIIILNKFTEGKAKESKK